MVFLTLTAPSFGPVHSRRVRRRQGAALPAAAQAARSARTACRSRAARCTTRTIRARRAAVPGVLRLRARGAVERARARAVAAHGDPAPARARAAARRQRRSGCGVRVSYVKVAEFQRRGALHFHCVLRLDGASEDGEVEPPAAEFGARAADRRRARGRAARVGASPAPEATAGCRGSAGQARRSAGARRSRCASSTPDGCGRASCAGYIAKYATKSTEAVGGLLYRLERERPRAAEGPAACPALRRVRVAARRRARICTSCGCGGGRTSSGSAGTASPRAAATRRRSRRCARRGTSTSCAAHGELRDRGARSGAGSYSGSGYRTLGRCLAGRVGPQARAGRSGGSRARSFAPAIRSAATVDEGRR